MLRTMIIVILFSLIHGDRRSKQSNIPFIIRNVFGIDDRVPVTSNEYPWSAIGKLSTSCTGTLVGRDVVLTAAHCVIDPQTNRLYTKAIYFYPNMIDGKSALSARVTYAWWGTTNPNDARENDWAVLRLDKKLGDTQGYLGIKTISIDTMKQTSGTLAGYSADFRNGQTAAAHRNCRIIKQVSTNQFLHGCDATRGSSGGPIFAYWNGKPYVYLLNVAEYRNDGDKSLFLSQFNEKNANIAIWSTKLEQKVYEFIRS